MSGSARAERVISLDPPRTDGAREADAAAAAVVVRPLRPDATGPHMRRAPGALPGGRLGGREVGPSRRQDEPWSAALAAPRAGWPSPVAE